MSSCGVATRAISIRRRSSSRGNIEREEQCPAEYMQQMNQPADLGAYSTRSMAMTKRGQSLASDIVILDEG